jgi:hypothetical protein
MIYLNSYQWNCYRQSLKNLHVFNLQRYMKQCFRGFLRNRKILYQIYTEVDKPKKHFKIIRLLKGIF